MDLDDANAESLHKKGWIITIVVFIISISILYYLDSTQTKKQLNIMSYNIRLDVKSDGINQWNNRREGVVSLIKEERPDIFGIQEGLPSQIKYLSKHLKEYNMIGEGRDGGDNGEYSAIYYKNKKLKVIKSENFWLSETPKTPSIGWDAALNRIATVCVFKLVKSNKTMIVYNSHFDHIGKKARENSVNVILNHIKENNFSQSSIVVMGDFNSTPTDTPIKLLSKHLEDSFNTFPFKKPIGTFNAFELDNKLIERIDYIFTKNIDVVEYKHIYKKLTSKLWPSDHLPIFISINEPY